MILDVSGQVSGCHGSTTDSNQMYLLPQMCAVDSLDVYVFNGSTLPLPLVHFCCETQLLPVSEG